MQGCLLVRDPERQAVRRDRLDKTAEDARSLPVVVAGRSINRSGKVISDRMVPSAPRMPRGELWRLPTIMPPDASSPVCRTDRPKATVAARRAGYALKNEAALIDLLGESVARSTCFGKCASRAADNVSTSVEASVLQSLATCPANHSDREGREDDDQIRRHTASPRFQKGALVRRAFGFQGCKINRLSPRLHRQDR